LKSFEAYFGVRNPNFSKKLAAISNQNGDFFCEMKGRNIAWFTNLLVTELNVVTSDPFGQINYELCSIFGGGCFAIFFVSFKLGNIFKFS